MLPYENLLASAEVSAKELIEIVWEDDETKPQVTALRSCHPDLENSIRIGLTPICEALEAL